MHITRHESVHTSKTDLSVLFSRFFFRARLREKFYRSQQKKRVFRWMLFVLIVFEKSRKSVKETPLPKKAR